jgi:hypothetical protein
LGGLGLANPVAQSNLIFLAAHREMLSAFKDMPLITSACIALMNRRINPLTAHLATGYKQLVDLDSTEAASHYATPLPAARKLQAKYTDLLATKTRKDLIDSHMPAALNPRDPGHMAAKADVIRLRSLARPHALSCLQVLPTATTHRFDNEAFAITLRLILGLTMLAPSVSHVRCFCGRPLTDVHVQVCTKSYQQTYRHNNVLRIIVRALRQAVLSPIMEQLTTLGKNRWDIVFINPLKPDLLTYADVTITSPLQEVFINASLNLDTQIPMNQAHKHKVDKYKLDIAAAPPGSTFLPLVLDSLGGFHSDLIKLLNDASPLAANLPPPRSINYSSPHYSTFWIQALSVATFIGTARSIAKTIRVSLRQNNTTALF